MFAGVELSVKDCTNIYAALTSLLPDVCDAGDPDLKALYALHYAFSVMARVQLVGEVPNDKMTEFSGMMRLYGVL